MFIVQYVQYAFIFPKQPTCPSKPRGILACKIVKFKVERGQVLPWNWIIKQVPIGVKIGLKDNIKSVQRAIAIWKNLKGFWKSVVLECKKIFCKIVFSEIKVFSDNVETNLSSRKLRICPETRDYYTRPGPDMVPSSRYNAKSQLGWAKSEWYTPWWKFHRSAIVVQGKIR